jgi:hypothetical protein
MKFALKKSRRLFWSPCSVTPQKTAVYVANLKFVEPENRKKIRLATSVGGMLRSSPSGFATSGL